MASGLIQMNVHMEVTQWAKALIVMGIFAAVVSFLIALSLLMNRERRLALVFAAIGLLGVALIVVGARMPRDRIITACANGPVSIEQVAAVYDVIEVDGKMMRLRER